MTRTTDSQAHGRPKERNGIAPTRRLWRRPSVNITPLERAGRILFGGAALIAGAVLLTSASSALAVVLQVLLLVAGLDLAVTGALGYCPLYVRLGHVPASLRKPT